MSTHAPVRSIRRDVILVADAFRCAAADCRRVTDWLTANRAIALRYNSDDADADRPPAFDDNLVHFNAPGDAGAAAFIVRRDGHYSSTLLPCLGRVRATTCTETFRPNGKPYDLAVCCLIVFARHFGDGFQATAGDDAT